MLRHMPELATANFFTAIVCGEIAEVERILRERPAAATEAGGPKGSAEAAGTHFILESTPAGPPYWEPLHYLCFTRLDRPASNDNAVAIARLLLDHGANPNAFFFAGSSHYTPLTGVIGAGEEGRPAHPRQDELTRFCSSAAPIRTTCRSSTTSISDAMCCATCGSPTTSRWRRDGRPTGMIPNGG